ncbi:MAG TPA: hypothetical protein G4O12_03325 [Dehalococcoidia bacterium]|nr:hypothetical protein [Dehalococcoidia bacterium]
MKKSKCSLLFYVRKVSLVVILAVCLIALLIKFWGAHSIQGSLAVPDFESMGTVEQQAWQLAGDVAGEGEDIQEQFVTELLDIYYEVKDSDFAIFCSSGGWGKEPLTADPQGQSWLDGIGAKLTHLGYKYCTVDYVRTTNGLGEHLFEFEELLAHYPSKAKELAAKVDFLTRQIGDLKIILAGQSNGAAFANEVARCLGDNPGVYSIQVGCPFWYQAPKASQSLVIYHNGLMVDALTNRDIMTLFRANHMKLFIINQAPSFTPLGRLVTGACLVFGLYDVNLGLEAPGHEYMWEYPGVGPVIEAFLVENFGGE